MKNRLRVENMQEWKMRHVLTSETEMLKCMCFFYYRKFLEIPILEEDSYEKNVVMYVVIGEPRHIAGNFHYIFTRVMDSITRSHRMTGDNRWSRSNIFVTSESVEKNRGLLRIEDFFFLNNFEDWKSNSYWKYFRIRNFRHANLEDKLPS